MRAKKGDRKRNPRHRGDLKMGTPSLRTRRRAGSKTNILGQVKSGSLWGAVVVEWLLELHVGQEDLFNPRRPAQEIPFSKYRRLLMEENMKRFDSLTLQKDLPKILKIRLCPPFHPGPGSQPLPDPPNVFQPRLQVDAPHRLSRDIGDQRHRGRLRPLQHQDPLGTGTALRVVAVGRGPAVAPWTAKGG